MEFRTGCFWGVYKSYVQECEIVTDFLRSMKLLHSILDVNEVTGVWSRMAAMAAQKASLREYSVMQGPPSGGQVAGVGFLLRCWLGRVRGSCMISLTSESQWSLWSAKAWPVGSVHKQRMNTIVFLQPQQIPRGYWSIELFVGVRGLPPRPGSQIWFPLRLWWCVEGSGEAHHIVRAVPADHLEPSESAGSLASLQREHGPGGGGGGGGERSSGLAFVPSRLAYWVF